VRATTIEGNTLTSILSQRERKKTTQRERKKISINTQSKSGPADLISYYCLLPISAEG
jgi:hypothetical protein